MIDRDAVHAEYLCSFPQKPQPSLRPDNLSLF